jgi:putative DNA methylase
MTTKRKLIEVALPLAAINEASAAEGSIGARPHPKNLHRWWARRPLSAARAVIWASLVDDPSSDASLSQVAQDIERQRLFRILERLVQVDDGSSLEILTEARAEINRCYPDGTPVLVDPFGGGGAIPLEAHRLGLATVSGDLNPVAVLIHRAMFEIPPLFANKAPVHPGLQNEMGHWTGTQGLSADVRMYGEWMRDKAFENIGAYYPVVEGEDQKHLTPIAYIWARTIESPDPSWSGHVPLVTTWTLSRKKGKESVWLEPIVDAQAKEIRYRIRHAGNPSVERTIKSGVGTCIATGATIPAEYIRSEARAGRLRQQLLAIVAQSAEKGEGKVYVLPDSRQVNAAAIAKEDIDIPPPLLQTLIGKAGSDVSKYGINSWADLYHPRQLMTLLEFSRLLPEVRNMVEEAALQSGWANDSQSLRDGGSGATAYAEAVTTYLAFVVNKFADWSSSACGWNNINEQIRNVFARQAILMTWDFAEVAPFSQRVASWDSQLSGLVGALRDTLLDGLNGPAKSSQIDARALMANHKNIALSTDPPYYDNICYADLSDFFYVWMRNNLTSIWPVELATLATPKSEELVANVYTSPSKSDATQHFEQGMADFMKLVVRSQVSDTPATIYYAYKATEQKNGAVTSTGWATFLQAIVDAGMTVTATWPLRTERAGRMISIGASALASSIVLTCRARERTAQIATRSDFVAALRKELPEAVRVLQSGNIAPVDIPQSTIGPGIGVFSRFARVVESDGSTMSVSFALSIINDVLGEIFDGEESEMDADSRFALTWYSQFGFEPGASGDADSMARAKNTSVSGIIDAGIGVVRAGRFRLRGLSELESGWSPLMDKRPTVWEATHHLIAALNRSESEAADLLRQLGGYGERARVLAYLLFKKATDRGWADEAGAYNGLIVAWPALQASGVPTTQQAMELG